MSHRYPDPDEIDEKLFDHLFELPDGNNIDISWLRKCVWPDAYDFEIPPSSVIRGMQANMFTIKMTSRRNSETSEETKVKTIIAKRVVPSELPSKEDNDKLKQFIGSVRREIEFYKTLMLQENKAIQHVFPRVYYSSSTPTNLDDTDPLNTSFLLLLSDLSDKYYQAPSMNREQANCLMKSFASFHAHFWQSPEVERMDRGGFWVLKRRLLYGELENANLTWAGILERLPELSSMGLDNINSLAADLSKNSEVLDQYIEARCDTLIHGDAKGWNLFLNKSSNDDIIFIDMQWVGKGHPLQDIAYALTTSLDANLLNEMDNFVNLYVKYLKVELEKQGRTIDDERLRLEYDIIWLDYARVIVTGLWKNLDPERMKRYQKTVGPSMINRSIDHVKFIIKKIHHLLYENQEFSHGLINLQCDTK